MQSPRRDRRGEIHTEMGLSQSASRRVSNALTHSNEFNSACASAYSHCLSLTQDAFPGVLPYQLLSASDHLHQALTSLHPHTLIVRWLPAPPSRAQVDSAYRILTCRILTCRRSPQEEPLLGPSEFRDWAVLLFADAVVGNAGKAVMKRVPIGVAGILGIGAMTKSGKELVGAAIGVYAIGVATSVYLGLAS